MAVSAHARAAERLWSVKINLITQNVASTEFYKSLSIAWTIALKTLENRYARSSVGLA